MATSVPLVEYLCSEVMDPLHGILLNYFIHLEFSDFGVFLESLTHCLVFFLFFSFRFQSERESGDRNFAIGYYLKEKKVNVFFLSVFLRLFAGFYL